MLFRSPSYSDMCFVDNAPEGTSKDDSGRFPFFVFLDNSCVNGNTWGIGLTAARDKNKIEKSWNTSRDGYTIESQYTVKMMNQFQNPKITGIYNDSDEKFHMYVSYYDAFSHCLKYSAYTYIKVATDQNNCVASFIVNAYTNQSYATVAGTYSSTAQTSFAEEAGEWSDVKVDTSAGYNSPVPVIVYYNKTKKTLQIARGKSAAPQGSSNWTKTNVVRPTECSDFGRYVSMEMDSNYGLHVTAQDVDNGALYYMYFTKNADGTYKRTICQKVDSTSSVGRWTDIKLEDSTKTDRKSVV